MDNRDSGHTRDNSERKREVSWDNGQNKDRRDKPWTGGTTRAVYTPDTDTLGTLDTAGTWETTGTVDTQGTSGDTMDNLSVYSVLTIPMWCLALLKPVIMTMLSTVSLSVSDPANYHCSY